MTQNPQTQNEKKPLDYYKLKSAYLRRRYGRRISFDTWVEGEFGIGDGAVLETHEVGGKTLYVLYYYADGLPHKRIVAMYDDMYVAHEVARVVHAVLYLERLSRSRLRRSRRKR